MAEPHRKGIAFPRFGGLRLDLPPDEVGAEEAAFLRDIDWDGSLGKIRPRDGFQKLKLAEASSDYLALFPHSPTRLLAVKRQEGGRLVAIDREGTEKKETSWGILGSRATFARFGTPAASYTYGRAQATSHKPIRFDGENFTTPTATVDGVAGKEMPRGNYMATWPAGGNRLVVANTGPEGGPNKAASSASHVWFSDPGSAETWHTVAPEANYVQLSPGDGEEITAVCVFGGQVFVFKETKFFVFYGVNVDSEGGPSFDFREVSLGEGSRVKRPPSSTLADSSDQLACAAPTGVYFCATDGIYVTTGQEPLKISRPLKPLEEASPFDGPMAEFLNGSTETCRWPAAGILSVGPRIIVKRYEYLFVYDVPTAAWTCWKIPNVSVALWTGLTGGGSEASTHEPSGNGVNASTGVAWTNPLNGRTINGGYALAKLGLSGASSKQLVITFGENELGPIPEAAIIKGIKVEAVRHATIKAGGTQIEDGGLWLVKGGVVQTATNKAKAGAWPTTDGTQTYGGPEDMWGNTWTPAQLNSSGFGIAVMALGGGSTNESCEAFFDGFRVTAYYTIEEANSGARPRLFVTNGKFIFWTGPAAEEQAGTREALWHSGAYDLGSQDEKELVESKVWGKGEVTLSSYRDFATTPGFSDTISLGSPAVAEEGRSYSSQAGTLFSHRLALAAGSNVQRLVRYLREVRTATAKSDSK